MNRFAWVKETKTDNPRHGIAMIGPSDSIVNVAWGDGIVTSFWEGFEEGRA